MYISQKKFRLALADCETARTLQPSKPDVRILLRHARCQVAIGAASSALKTLQTAREAQPGIGKTTDYKSLKEQADQMQQLFRKIGTERRHQSWESGRRLVTRLLGMLECQYEDTEPRLIVWDMEFRIAAQKFESALETLSALTEKQEDVKYFELKARACFLLNRLAEAVTALKKALQLKKDDRVLLALLQRVQECETSKESGNQAFRRGDWTIAVGKYTAALKKIGFDSADGCGGIIRAILLSNRACAYIKMGAEKSSAALDDLAQSIRLHPKNWKAFRSRGKVWVMTEKYKKAVRDYHCAIEILGEDGATAAARRELEEELHEAQSKLKGVSEPTHYGKHSCLFGSIKLLNLSQIFSVRRRKLQTGAANVSLIELERTCTTVEIKKAYRRESLIHHPDKVYSTFYFAKSHSQAVQGGDEDTFKMISEAHTTLSDPVRRRELVFVSAVGRLNLSPRFSYNERIDRMQYCEDTSDDNSDDDNLYPYDSDNPYPYDSDEELADIFFTHAFGRGYGFFDY